MDAYIFTSKRLGFRNWTTTDIDVLSEINSNQKVMQFFPSTQTQAQTAQFITKMQQQYDQKGFCYFAVELLENHQCIGFIGLSQQTFLSDFTPAVDIGWRLHPNFWGKGYATEGAKKCLEYGFNKLKLNEIIAIAPKINLASIGVMQKIGMTKMKQFEHPLLSNHSILKDCVLYTKNRLVITNN